MHERHLGPGVFIDGQHAMGEFKRHALGDWPRGSIFCNGKGSRIMQYRRGAYRGRGGVQERMRKPFIGGNWKMNGSMSLVESFGEQKFPADKEVVIFPPFPYLAAAVSRFRGASVGAQNCYLKEKGAFTGEVSAPMLRDVGVQWVLVGHSERRALFLEGDNVISGKVEAALRAGLRVVLCVGETAAERAVDATFAVVERQIDETRASWTAWTPENMVIAYEPIWAIGTGQVATPQQAQQVLHHLRRRVLAPRLSEAFARGVRLIYGGSVDGANALDLAALPDVDGFLVGGASLRAVELACIVENMVIKE